MPSLLLLFFIFLPPSTARHLLQRQTSSLQHGRRQGLEAGRRGGTPSHPLSIYGHEVYTQRGILSLELMNGEEGRGSCQSVYKERKGKSLM